MNQKERIAFDAATSRYEAGVSKVVIAAVLNTLSDVAQAEFQKGEGAEVTLPGIGKLSVKQSPARIGRNPATGVEISIPAKNKPHFSAAKALKDAVMSN